MINPEFSESTPLGDGLILGFGEVHRIYSMQAEFISVAPSDGN
jgi:hypothetical protein